MVLKQSVTGGTRQGILTSLGVGAGILIHVSYCLLGMSILFAQSDMLLTAMKYLAASGLSGRADDHGFKPPSAGS